MTQTTKRGRVDWAMLIVHYMTLLMGILIGLWIAVKYGNAWPEWK
jgi:uncharacterized membrane protein YfcA